jgi:hypothetical protein
MGVAFVPTVHNSGSHGEVQNLGLTPPNHGQTLGDKARAGAKYRVTIRPESPSATSAHRPEWGNVPAAANWGHLQRSVTE